MQHRLRTPLLLLCSAFGGLVGSAGWGVDGRSIGPWAGDASTGVTAAAAASQDGSAAEFGGSPRNDFRAPLSAAAGNDDPSPHHALGNGAGHVAVPAPSRILTLGVRVEGPTNGPDRATSGFDGRVTIDPAPAAVVLAGLPVLPTISIQITDRYPRPPPLHSLHI